MSTVVQVQLKERPILFSGAMVRAILEGRKSQTRRVVKLDSNFYNGNEQGVQYTHKAEAWRFWASHSGSLDQQIPGGRISVKAFDATIAEDRTCPYGKPGDRLWVREAFYVLDMRPNVAETPDAVRPIQPSPVSIQYQATADDLSTCKEVIIRPEDWRESFDNDHIAYKPSIHMPRWASRLALEITKVRVERVQEISEEDARAEGCSPSPVPAPDTFSDPDHRQLAERMAGGEFSAKLEYAMLWDSINSKRGYGWDKNPWVWVIEFKLAGGEKE